TASLHDRSTTHTQHYPLFFFFHDSATTEIYTLSLHDALPISTPSAMSRASEPVETAPVATWAWSFIRMKEPLPNWRSIWPRAVRSEEHTSELQSRFDLVCRLLLEKKNKQLRN